MADCAGLLLKRDTIGRSNVPKKPAKLPTFFEV
jgi:hypothetical protein